MKKLLITGASGFIGGFLVEEALRKNYEVFAAIRKKSNTEHLKDSRIKFIGLDLSDIDLLNRQLFEAPYFDYVIHNAGITKAIKKEVYFETNYTNTRNLIDVLLCLRKVPEKFIYISSLAAYGPGDEKLLSVIKSSDVPKPITSYGESKLLSEKYLMSLSDFPFLIMRPTAVYGPREKDLFTLFKMINKNIELFIGYKEQHLTFIFVRDLVKVIFLAMESNQMNKGYFVSDGNVYDAKEFGKAIKEELGKKTIKLKVPLSIVKLIARFSESSKYITGKQPVLNSEKINELKAVNWKCDIQPLKDDFNFMPDYTLRDGINETLKWYKQENWL